MCQFLSQKNIIYASIKDILMNFATNMLEMGKINPDLVK